MRRIINSSPFELNEEQPKNMSNSFYKFLAKKKKKLYKEFSELPWDSKQKLSLRKEEKIFSLGILSELG